jgi:tRNA (guanosine-2'-O-)-methyltransferase
MPSAPAWRCPARTTITGRSTGETPWLAGRTSTGRSKLSWIREERETSRIVADEVAEDATLLTRLAAARTRTVVLLGQHDGVPAEKWDLIDEVVEIPMVGQGSSLNVAVAGSLVLYRLAGLM